MSRCWMLGCDGASLCDCSKKLKRRSEALGRHYLSRGFIVSRGWNQDGWIKNGVVKKTKRPAENGKDRHDETERRNQRD